MPKIPSHCPKLIALDMDGTLLDGNGAIPDAFWPLLERARARDIVIAPASGRQLATLRDMFEGGPHAPVSFIAENGTAVFHEGAIIDSTALPGEAVQRALSALSGVDVTHGVVVCTPELAFIREDLPRDIIQEIRKYCHSLELVPDLAEAAARHEVIKLAIYCAAGGEEHIAPVLFAAVGDHNVTISGPVWVDVMRAGVNKGTALVHMAGKLGIDIRETAAFGDFLNDFEMLEVAGTAVAMDNAHEKLKAIADIIAPANTEQGVISTLEEFLRLPD